MRVLPEPSPSRHEIYLDGVTAVEPIAPLGVMLVESVPPDLLCMLLFSLRAAFLASLAFFFSALVMLDFSELDDLPAVGEGLTLSLGFVVPPMPVWFGAAGLAAVMPGAAVLAVAPFPAVGAGLGLSLGLVVPGVMVALPGEDFPELLLASAPARAGVAVLPGAGVVASCGLVVPGGVVVPI